MSRLSTLVKRVRAAECNPGMFVEKQLLVNLAECLTYYRPYVDYSEEETQVAIKILQDYKLAHLIGREDLIGKELANPRRVVVKCKRCGRILWDPKSVVQGVGPVCIHKPVPLEVIAR